MLWTGHVVDYVDAPALHPELGWMDAVLTAEGYPQKVKAHFAMMDIPLHHRDRIRVGAPVRWQISKNVDRIQIGEKP